MMLFYHFLRTIKYEITERRYQYSYKWTEIFFTVNSGFSFETKGKWFCTIS